MLEIAIIVMRSLAAGVLGSIPTRLVLKSLWTEYYKIPGAEKSIGEKRIYEQVQLYSTVLGIVERSVYATGWQLGHPEVIAVILAIKAAPALKEWEGGQLLGRAQFNVWLIGVLLSMMTSVLTVELFSLIDMDSGFVAVTTLALIVAIGAIVGDTAGTINRRRKKGEFDVPQLGAASDACTVK